MNIMCGFCDIQIMSVSTAFSKRNVICTIIRIICCCVLKINIIISVII